MRYYYGNHQRPLLYEDLRVTIEDCTFANAFSASFQQSVFLSMEAKTGGETDSSTITAVAPGT
jgi:hypothetical protein